MKMEKSGKWIKNNPKDKVWWLDIHQDKGTIVFLFDRKERFYLYREYFKMNEEQQRIFDKENPFWVNFFHGEGNNK